MRIRTELGILGLILVISLLMGGVYAGAQSPLPYPPGGVATPAADSAPPTEADPAQLERWLAPKRRVDGIFDFTGLPELADGRSVRLADCLDVSSFPGEYSSNRGHVLAAYWRAAELGAKWRIQRVRRERLESLAPQTVAPQSLVVAATAEEEAALLEFKRARIELRDVVGFSRAEPLPYPADAPYVGRYRTALDEIQRYRTVSSRATRLNELLLVQRGIIDVRHEACAAAEALLAAYDRDARAGVNSFEQYAFAVGFVRDRQAEFIESVRRYNDDIADYVGEVVGPEVRGEPLIRALIKVETPAGAAPPTESAPIESTPLQPGETLRSTPLGTLP